MRLILASSSPRRQELLRAAGIDFEVRPSGVEEVRLPGESPQTYVRRTARAKALAVAAIVPSAADAMVLGADTEVVMNSDILGKPRDDEDAARMLRMLSGRTHHVITGVCLVRPLDIVEALAHETTLVAFCSLGEQEIRDYVRSGEPFDKAGAYAIQGLASRFVTRIEGCYFNVVGLPIPMVYGMIKPFFG